MDGEFARAMRVAQQVSFSYAAPKPAHPSKTKGAPPDEIQICCSIAKK